MSDKFKQLGSQDEVNDQLDALTDEILKGPVVSDMIEAALEDEEHSPTFIPLGGIGDVNERLDVIEKRQAAFEAILIEFRERALQAFKHAGFKF
jgi:hypothetical protein